jgi:hypothetical protein
MGVVCGDGQEPIVCYADQTGLVSYTINALVSNAADQTFNVTFKYVDDGIPQERTFHVVQNARLPWFHLHQRMPTDDGFMVFKYWTVESGNLSSSFTVLSDLVLVASYDIVGEMDLSMDAPTAQEPVPMFVEIEQEPVPSLECELYDGCCQRANVSPLDSGENVFPESLVCPLKDLIDRRKHEDGDFDVMTLIEIEDVANLIKALFKINIDIAHKEYYLKVDIPDGYGWWYGYQKGELGEILCDPSSPIVCPMVLCEVEGDVVYGNTGKIVCEDDSQIVCGSGDFKVVSFEPTVEFKFSNFHAINQVENGKLVCTVSGDNALEHPMKMWITPVNRELLHDAKDVRRAVQYNDFWYYYDYANILNDVLRTKRLSEADDYVSSLEPFQKLDDEKYYYTIQPLHLYENTVVQSPTDVDGFLRHEVGGLNPPIKRNENQLRTFVSVVKKYRPIIMPGVRDVFNDCVNNKTKYDVDRDNDYGVFGWCTIPSKTMVNMEYNEQSIIVPSSYDHHNRIGGSNFLQMDKDFERIYKKWIGDKQTGGLVDNIKNTWYYVYNTRDWTYFINPLFDVKPNDEIYSQMMDTYSPQMRPANSNHLNGVIFEFSNLGRAEDPSFGDMVDACEFLAKRHHNENNLRILSEKFTKVVSYQKLKELTAGDGEFNSVYGSQYDAITDGFRFPQQDWVDDYDKTGSYVGLGKNDYNPVADGSSNPIKYTYNLGQAHAIDDFDENSVWFYITMVDPLDEVNQVVEIEDIMPFVFWWENRGKENNGPTVDCYGLQSNAKLNYEQGGWCYSSGYDRVNDEVDLVNGQLVHSPGDVNEEHRWHAVQHTLGVDFSKKDNGGTILNTDNSGNVFKGAFDPNCVGTDEKWKIHNTANSFGANQHEDPVEDKYKVGPNAHGEGSFNGLGIPPRYNEGILGETGSLQDRPMCWNLWNVVRHYVYIKDFKNKSRMLDSDATWDDLELRTRKIVKGIYRTFQQNRTGLHGERDTFYGHDESCTHHGGLCLVPWTNSFVEISSILDRNAREHEASFVLFTGDVRRDFQAATQFWRQLYPDAPVDLNKASIQKQYDDIKWSKYNFRILTLNGFDDDEDGMRPRSRILNSDDQLVGWELVDQTGENAGARAYQGFKFDDMPTNYVIGDSLVYQQFLPEREISLSNPLDFDLEYPYCEYRLNSNSLKWIRKITQSTLNKQLIPVYTSMETMDVDPHDLTDEDMKSITFQVVPQFYWKYEWSFNDFMIHRVGELNPISSEVELYDMLGNVWELVRDDWSDKISCLVQGEKPIHNSIVGESSDNNNAKVIKGGAFD